MDATTLRKVQLTQLAILKEFDRVCRKHNISYILSSGTLLGAVRHQGFIPWDDDLDVDMTRENYQRFLACADELPENLFLQNWHNDEEYGLPFSKIRLKNSAFREEACAKMKNCGIYIDIFPCDKFTDDASERRRFQKLNHYRMMILILSPVYGISPDSALKRAGLHVLRWFLHSKKWKRRYIEKFEQLTQMMNNTDVKSRYYENGGATPIGQWIIEPLSFKNTTLLQFEDASFSCPEDYDTYLRAVYGDYMELPPEDKRADRHGILEVSFGEEMK